MSFLTEYVDEYRTHPIRKTLICRPEARYVKLEGKWLERPGGTTDSEWSDEDIAKFIKEATRSMRGNSTYFNEHCAHLSQEFKTRQFVPRLKKKRPCVEIDKKEEEVPVAALPAPKLAIKDTELMKVAKEMYERDMKKLTLEPLVTHTRLFGYARPNLFGTGLSTYQETIARLAFELVRDDRLPKYYAHNGNRPRWGYPPEGTRQPVLDGIPYHSERVF